jgi:hypothetical protein
VGELTEDEGAVGRGGLDDGLEGLDGVPAGRRVNDRVASGFKVAPVSLSEL